MKVGSLFSGIGGLELGLEWAGMETAWQVERDPYACRVLAKHWPNVPRYHDVRTFNAADAPRVDLVCGGFPCQPHSVAGSRRASADDRDLWGEFARVIREARPKWVVAENVPGLLSSEAGRFFGRVLADLASLGFNAEWFVLPAAAVGAPHRRERIFIVAYTYGAQRQGDRGAERVPAKASSDSGSQQENVGYANGQRQLQPQGSERDERGRPGDTGGWWATEPDVGRVAHGVPSRVDRLKCLGNAVVPQVAYVIGQRIMQMEAK